MNTPRMTRRITAITAPAIATIFLLTGCGLSTPDEVITPADTPSVVETMQPGSTDEATPETPTDGATPTETTDALNTGDDDLDDTTFAQGGISVDPKKAAQVALEAHSGSRVVDIDLDRTRGVTVWEVKVVTAGAKFEVDVDAVTGEVVTNERESTDDLAKYNSRLDRAKLTHADAIDSILDTHPGATVVELDLDEDDGVVVWEAEAVTTDHIKYELEIHAVTGKILKNERED